MSDPRYELNSNWRWLDSEWSAARTSWRDESASEFENDFLSELQAESGGIAAAAEELMVVLARAAEVARRS